MTFNFTPPSTRDQLITMLSAVLPVEEEACRFLFEMAVDHGPPERRAANQASIVALVLVATAVVKSPQKCDKITNLHPKHSRHRHGPHSSAAPDAEATLPLGLPDEIIPSFISFSEGYLLDIKRLDSGPNHERAALIIQLNLIYQIARATGRHA